MLAEIITVKGGQLPPAPGAPRSDWGSSFTGTQGEHGTSPQGNLEDVEHDFRIQEGAVTRTWRVGDPPEGSPLAAVTPQPATPHRVDSPLPGTPARASHSGRKSRKKCFWFL
ncbi:hypothetical protein DPEC_G00333960 [Dallia pectoralis]|uniref:Uncharacterized protein n=1 Tax=Dallia pectoralis TaxID=75939 RepID=A0ACC2F6K4_DALPE|nr:hypothetical protein DPEC_G00333960 [Dallia pectoralis]